MSDSFLEGRVILHPGDCLEVARTLADASVDAVVTDPPYALVSIGKRFGAENAAPCKAGKTGAYQRAAAGFMGKKWDTGETAFAVEFWAEILRVLKPGGHVAAFGGTRSYHRLACAIEDAGFEIRDQLAWVYGSGFPKSHNISKGIDKERDVEGSLGGARTPAHEGRTRKVAGVAVHERAWMSDPIAVDRNNREYLPGSEDGAAWKGWGTALKPAWEPICLARKPLSEKSVAANVLKHGAGAINVDACRVEITDRPVYHVDGNGSVGSGGIYNGGWKPDGHTAGANPLASSLRHNALGRWPANLIHDGSAEVLAGFPETSSGFKSGGQYSRDGGSWQDNVAGDMFRAGGGDGSSCFADSGSASRFFYSAKADADDRLGSKHPTVKPVDLMQWLCRLITPPGGIVLDPFAGTGTTGEAAWREGFAAILIERETEYLADIARRMAHATVSRRERKQTIVKAKRPGESAGPLFGEQP